MQLDNLYPTAATSYGVETTALFMNISGLIDDMGDQYLMGYVNSDDISMVAPVEIINGGDTVTMSRVSGNFGWGYAAWNYYGSYGPGTLYYNDNGTLTRSWGINYDFAFINAIEMARVNTQPRLIPWITVAAVNADLIDGYKMTRIASVALNLSEVHGTSLDNYVDNEYTIDSWKNIIDNDLPIFSGTVTITGASITVPLTLRPSDFENDNGMKFALIPTDSGYTLHCRIVGLKIGNTKYYYDSSNTFTNNIIPFFQFPDIGGNPAIVAPGTCLQSQVDLYYENGGIYVTRGSVSGYYNEMFLQGGTGENSRIFGGFDYGTLSVNDIDFTDVFNQSLDAQWAFVGNYALQRLSVSGGQARFRVNGMYTPREIYDYVRFWHKRTDTPSDSYSAADTVTVFETSETPTSETVSGTLSEIAARLRPWQLPNVDITSNTFTPEDIPVPTPEPSDDEETGDSIIRPGSIVVGSTAGFLTQYVLTAANVAELGAALWSGIGDSNFWQNVLWTTLSASASFDVSSLLQYFISLRVYPFPLVNVSTYAGTGDNKIHIGRGAVPLTLGTSPNVGTISQYADILDAGTVQVPAYYGDFRDYAQTDIILHAPYIGTVTLAPADVIGATLHLVYAIDFAAGSCTAYLDISRGGFTYPVCLGSGVIGADVPLTADSASRRAAALFGLGDAALTNIGQNASAERGAEGELDLEVNPYGMLAGAARGILGANPIAPTMSGIGKGFDSFAGAQTAYIQIRRAITKNPGNQAQAYGRQTATTARLGDLSGFTVCHNVDVSGLECDLETKSQIKRLLEAGVYI